jgi:hypothetical protein
MIGTSTYVRWFGLYRSCGIEVVEYGMPVRGILGFEYEFVHGLGRRRFGFV